MNTYSISPVRRSGLGSSSCAYLVSQIAENLWQDKDPPGSSGAGQLGEERTPSVNGSGRIVLVLVPTIEDGESLLSDLRFFLSEGDCLHSFFSWEMLPFDALSPTSIVSAARLYTMFRLTRNLATVVVATVPAMMQRIVSSRVLEETIFPFRAACTLDRDYLVAFLDRGGYSRSSLVEECGQMAVRGAIVDFFPPGSSYPIRAELFGDQLESVRSFDPSTQRSFGSLSGFDVIPVREFFVPWYSEQFLPDTEGTSVDRPERQAVVNNIKNRASELSIPQLGIKPVEEALVYDSPWPGIEHLQPLFSERLDTLWDYLPVDAPVIVWDRAKVDAVAGDFEELVLERAERVQEEGRLFPEPESAYLQAGAMSTRIEDRVTHSFDPVSFVAQEHLVQNKAQSAKGEDLEVSLSPFASNIKLISDLRAAKHKERPFKPLAKELRSCLDKGFSLAVTVNHPSRVQRMKSMLEAYDLFVVPYDGSFASWQDFVRSSQKNPAVYLLQGVLSSGFRAAEKQFALITDKEIFPEISARRLSRSSQSVRRLIGSISQLKEEDYVVHADYGIGIYHGLKILEVEEKVGDFLELEYADNAKLFVPVENICKVQKYSGAEGRRPVLTKLGGKSWERTKKKVKANVAELAGELLRVMAERELVEGNSFAQLAEEEQDFADSFAFEETPDQSAAIADVLADLGKSRPMDRLVCGDVGYGKTEVALRAAFRVASAGKQTAVLVPTTVLAEQHYATFKERFADTAVTIGCVSRFYSSQENKETLSKLASGQLDVIIGTHRILQKDVVFGALGLVIIDEEHRFGVAHKERLKRLRSEIDVLTLTATPIPRTLHMSLSGIRELSLIETPPCDRQVIRTYIAAYQESIVREAILRELGRSGQVFYIHNRVQNIDLVAQEVAELVPEARVGIAHGQMKDKQLEEIMHRFITQEIDVLVSTTIVESGLDIPNANTMIIRKADNFGLAELYQLRGRVGRSSRRAYAYLLISDPRTIGSEAKKRLEVLQSLDDLGVGFRLALQDMEIRGAGNLLGKDQSGQINMVGYELYSRILKEAVGELRDRRRGDQAKIEPVRPEVDPELRIGFPAHIPPHYIPDIGERLLLYQRLTQLAQPEEGWEMAEEIEDRFGHLPEEVHVLIELMVFRCLLRQTGITSAVFRKQKLSLSFHPQISLDVDSLLSIVAESDGKLLLSPSMNISIVIDDTEVGSPKILYHRVRGFSE